MTGYLESIDRVFGRTIVNINDGTPLAFMSVQCIMERGQDDQLAKYNKGDRMILRGKIDGFALIVVNAVACVLVE